MNDRDLKRIEDATGCELPGGYRALLLNFPRSLRLLLEFHDKDCRQLFTDAATIVRWNKFFRAPGYSYENSYGEICQFPSHHIVIGANGGGDFFHLDSKRKRTAVYFWCHDDGELSVESRDLAVFIRSIFRSTCDLALDGLEIV